MLTGILGWVFTKNWPQDDSQEGPEMAQNDSLMAQRASSAKITPKSSYNDSNSAQKQAKQYQEISNLLQDGLQHGTRANDGPRMPHDVPTFVQMGPRVAPT